MSDLAQFINFFEDVFHDQHEIQQHRFTEKEYFL